MHQEQSAIEERKQTQMKLAQKEEESEEEEAAEEHRSPWIDAWSDKLAGVHSSSGLMAMFDLKGDGDHKFIICDYLHNFSNKAVSWHPGERMPKKLKIFMGTNVIYETFIPDRPVGLQIVFDRHQRPFQPMIAVAANDGVCFIKDFTHGVQFTLPLIHFSQAESSIWAQLMKLTKISMQAGDDATESS